MRKKQLVLRRTASPSWALTPVGVSVAVQLAGSIDGATLQAELTQLPAAELANVPQPVIDPNFAPPRWRSGIAELLKLWPFERNVFCMTRFAEPENSEDGPLVQVIDVVGDVLDAHGLKLHLASDQQLDDELWGNVGAYMWACCYGIGLIEDRVGAGLNDNVLIELGSMLVSGRRCALLVDLDAPELPTDLAGHIYKRVDFADPAAVATQVHHWVSRDLRLGPCASCGV